MVRSVAVLSDTHGVLPAVEAALAEPALQRADRVVVTGDLASGPQPVAVLDRLLELGERVVLVRGNADRELTALVGGEKPEIADEITAWAAGQLGARPDLVALLRDLPHPVTLDVDGFGPVLFCHGSPRDDNEVVLVDTRPQRWAEALAAVPDNIRTVVCGHTHMPFVRLVDSRLLINSGSVGMPYGGAGAHWALLADGHVTLGVTAFDIEAARRSIAEFCDYADIDEWTDYFLNSRASDFEALEVFGPRDGR